METKSQTQNDRNTGSTIRRRVEKILREYWYLVVLLFAALVVNENIVQWVLAVQIGGHTVGTGFEDAFEYFTIFGYLFLTAFRLVPYAGLGIAVVILSKTELKNYVLPVFIGGLMGILVIILWGSWMALRPFYTEEHVSSTTAVSFIIIPIYAVPAGVLGAVFLAAIYTPLRFITKRKEAEQIVDPKA
jgi:hypothetical protein